MLVWMDQPRPGRSPSPAGHVPDHDAVHLLDKVEWVALMAAGCCCTPLDVSTPLLFWGAFTTLWMFAALWKDWWTCDMESELLWCVELFRTRGINANIICVYQHPCIAAAVTFMTPLVLACMTGFTFAHTVLNPRFGWERALLCSLLTAYFTLRRSFVETKKHAMSAFAAERTSISAHQSANRAAVELATEQTRHRNAGFALQVGPGHASFPNLLGC